MLLQNDIKHSEMLCWPKVYSPTQQETAIWRFLILIDAGALSFENEEVCPSANFGTATTHGQHLLYIGMAKGG